MQGTGTDRTMSATDSVGEGRTPGRRRQFVVDPRYQLRAGVLVGLVALVLLVLLNVSLFLPQQAAAGAGAAALRSGAGRADGMSWTLILLGSAVLILGVTLIGVLESHRTAGAAYAIRRAVDELTQGRTGVRIRLRQGDHLQDLARAINRLAETIEAERLEGR